LQSQIGSSCTSNIHTLHGAFYKRQIRGGLRLKADNTLEGDVTDLRSEHVTNRQFRNLENVERNGLKRTIMKNSVLFLKMKDKMQKEEILMPTEQSSFKERRFSFLA
jgi:hypothetical protein